MDSAMLVLAEATRQNILKKLKGRPLKKRAPSIPSASTRALREVMSERDAQILVEGDAHERGYVAQMDAPARLRRPDLPEPVTRALDVLREQVDSTASDTSTALMPPSDWNPSAPNIFGHPRLPGHRISVDGDRWTHRLADGTIKKRGQGQASLHEYAKTLAYQDAPSEGLADVLARVRSRALGESLRPPLKAVQVMEAIQRREGHTAEHGDLGDRMRRLLTGHSR